MAQWYYGENGQQTGPVDDDGIRAALSAGLLNPNTMVWREGMLSWTPLLQVPELAGGSVVPGYSGYQPGGYAIPAPTSGLAIASMVCGIVGFCLCYVWALAGIPAVICGHMALSRINKSDYPMGGRGMALTGVILGYVLIAINIAIVITLVVMVSRHSTI